MIVRSIEKSVALFAVLTCLYTVQGAVAAENSGKTLNVVVSVKPIHSLVSAVMSGVGKPLLLIPGAYSPHDYALKPSDAKALQAAHVIFWIGEPLETLLAKPLKTLGPSAKKIALLDHILLVQDNVRRKENTSALTTGTTHNHHQPKSGQHDHTDPATEKMQGHGHENWAIDPHIWLDPDFTKLMVDKIVDTLTVAAPAHGSLFEKNGKAISAGITKLSSEMANALRPVSHKPFLVYHDAYAHLAKRFNLNLAGAITAHPENAIGVASIRKIRAKLIELSGTNENQETKGGQRHKKPMPICIFAEPQFSDKTIKVIAEGLPVKIGTLDPLGVETAEGPDHYFTMMGRNTKALVDCLQSQGS